LTAELLTEAWAYVKQDEKELPTVERPARTLNVHRDSLYAWAKPIADDEQVDPEIAELARTCRVPELGRGT
jgi:hypothetical protein